jgi:putative hydrolase of the HAD superfamily
MERLDTWMVGNSPKSDINPALEAGLGAVLIPHPHTWVLELQEVRAPEGARFLRVERFSDLSQYF